MDKRDVVRTLIERNSVSMPDTINVYVDRLVLRLYSYPSYLVQLKDVSIVDGNTVELVFYQLPEDSLTPLKELIGKDNDIEMFTFNELDKSYIGIRVKVRGVRDPEGS